MKSIEFKVVSELNVFCQMSCIVHKNVNTVTIFEKALDKIN